MINIDLNSNNPVSKMSLIGSEYSFDEELDKKAIAELMSSSEHDLDMIQNSRTVLKDLAKSFDVLLSNIKSDLGK